MGNASDEALWRGWRPGPKADRNLGALAREIRRTQLAVAKIENRL